MTMKKDAVGNNPLSHLIPRGPALRPPVPAMVQAPAAALAPTPTVSAPLAATPAAVGVTPVASAPAASAASAEPAVSMVPASAPPPAVAAHRGATPAPATPLPASTPGESAVDADSAPGGTGATPLKRCTVRLPVALLERMTSAIVHTPGMTQADFVADALVAHLAVLEQERGSAFPAYGKRLRPGRKSW